METVKVQWHSLRKQWLVETQNNTTFSFSEWAEQLPDLTRARMVLSASNYAVHWLSLVGVSQRHLAKVLPFALEESLIQDVNDYLILPAGSVDKKFRAFVVAAELIESLLATCELHHIDLVELIPETGLLDKKSQCVRKEGGWNFYWPGYFEGYVPDNALTTVLDAIFENVQQIEKIVIQARSLDQINLFKTVLETSYSGQVADIEAQVVDTDAWDIPNKPLNLLTGKFQPKVPKEERPAVWWKPVAGLAAAWLVLWTASLYSEVRTLKTQASEVQSQSLTLYKNLFPGERIRSLERQFKEKLSGGASASSEGFLNNAFVLAQVHAQEGLQGKLEILSLRYNERLAETTLEVKAKNLTELQALRQALENSGLKAEIASATNDQDGVRGRVRIAG